MVTVVLSDMSAAFDPVSPVTFRFDRLELIQDLLRSLDLLTRPFWRGSELIWRTGGRIELLLPYATLEPVRELLLSNLWGKVWTRFNLGNSSCE